MFKGDKYWSRFSKSKVSTDYYDYGDCSDLGFVSPKRKKPTSKSVVSSYDPFKVYKPKKRVKFGKKLLLEAEKAMSSYCEGDDQPF